MSAVSADSISNLCACNWSLIDVKTSDHMLLLEVDRFYKFAWLHMVYIVYEWMVIK